MLQYKIPQNVEIEDSIIGPITMRQLIIIAVGGGTAYVFYIVLAPTYYIETWGPPVFFFSILTVCVAFVSIKGIRFVRWIFLMIEAFMMPRQRMWDKEESTQFLFPQAGSIKKETKIKKKTEQSKEEEEEETNQLDELTKSLNLSEAIDSKEKNPAEQ